MLESLRRRPRAAGRRGGYPIEKFNRRCCRRLEQQRWAFAQAARWLFHYPTAQIRCKLWSGTSAIRSCATNPNAAHNDSNETTERNWELTGSLTTHTLGQTLPSDARVREVLWDEREHNIVSTPSGRHTAAREDSFKGQSNVDRLRHLHQ